jgi:hypothetical protein
MDGSEAGGAIAFGLGSQLDRYRRVGRYDVAFRLEENRWNGTVTPQLQVRRIFDEAPRYENLRADLAARWKEGDGAWDEQTRAIFAEAWTASRWRPRLEDADCSGCQREAPDQLFELSGRLREFLSRSGDLLGRR